MSTPSNSAAFSPRFRLFFWGSIAVLLLNVLIYNDFARIWPWEAHNWIQWLEAPTNLPQYCLAFFDRLFEGTLFWMRLPTVLLLLGALGTWYYWGKAIFGMTMARDTLLILATSFTLVFSAKLAVNELWLFVPQLLSFLALLRFLKKRERTWHIVLYLSILVGLAVHPWSMTVFVLVLMLYLRMFHPLGKNLDRLYLWLLVPLLFLTSYWKTGFVFSYGHLAYWKYLLWMLLGFLPWTGLLIASFADLIYKLRKKEEMALIISGFLLASLAAQSLMLTAVLALMIARQLSAYFHPNYPYQSLAKGFAILHLLFSFFAITIVLLSAYTQVGGLGFRAGMTVGVVYWILTFVAVIGLYARRRDFIFGGMAWGAMLGFFLFWVQLYPLMERQEISWQEVLQSTSHTKAQKRTLKVEDAILAVAPSLAVYAQKEAWEIDTLSTLNSSNKETLGSSAVYITAKPGSAWTKQPITEQAWPSYSWTAMDSLSIFVWELAE